MELDSTINNTINVIYKNFNISFPSSNNRRDYYNYLDIILNIIKKPKHVPPSWLDEKYDLEDRIKNIESELERLEEVPVKGDSFGDGMPLAPLNPNAYEEQLIKRYEDKEKLKALKTKYKKQLDAVEKKINILNIDFDENIKDVVKELIEIAPNESYGDVMKQFYIYRKNYKTIANVSYISEETAKSYRKRGFNSLVDILFDFTKKTH